MDLFRLGGGAASSKQDQDTNTKMTGNSKNAEQSPNVVVHSREFRKQRHVFATCGTPVVRRRQWVVAFSVTASRTRRHGRGGIQASLAFRSTRQACWRCVWDFGGVVCGASAALRAA